MVALGSTAIDTTKFGSSDVTSLYLGSNEAWTAGEPAELIKPTSIANSGGTASIGTNGQVTFSGITSLSLNECFTADFDNYVVSIKDSPSTANNSYLRLRASGTDATASDYTYQYLIAAGSSILASRSTTGLTLVNRPVPSVNGTTIFLYGPALAQPTAARSIGVNSETSATLYDVASTHNVSSSYDGFTYFPNVYSLSGTIQVYGIRM